MAILQDPKTWLSFSPGAWKYHIKKCVLKCRSASLYSYYMYTCIRVCALQFPDLWLCGHTWPREAGSAQPHISHKPNSQQTVMALSYWWPGPKMKRHSIFLEKLSVIGGSESTFRLVLIIATYDNRVGFIFMLSSRWKWSILQFWLLCIYTMSCVSEGPVSFHESPEPYMELHSPKNMICSNTIKTLNTSLSLSKSTN